MKPIIYVVFFLVFITTTCKPKQVDLDKAKSDIVVLLDKYRDAMANKDANAFERLLTDNGLYCGSDPKEFWNKKTLLELVKQMYTDSSNWKYTVERREIRIAPDGNSAIALDQFTVPAISKKLPFRIVFYLTKENDTWKFDFYSAAFIPKNEDVEKLNKALE